MDELKLCPFCGGEAGFAAANEYDECFSVVCKQCGLIIGQYAKNDEGNWENLFYKSPELAAKAWNRRATMWRHEIIEKLRKNLAELPSDMIEYNLGYAVAISDLEHIAEAKEG